MSQYVRNNLGRKILCALPFVLIVFLWMVAGITTATCERAEKHLENALGFLNAWANKK